MYLYGAGGHAKVVIEILNQNKIPIGGIFDDIPSADSLLGHEILDASELRQLKDYEFIITIGNNKLRKKIAKKLGPTKFGTVIHHTSNISESALINDGSLVTASVTINACCKIGDHCIINTGSVIDHDCQIDSYVHIGPNATLCGNIVIEEGALIGAGAVIGPGVKIGKWAIIGAGTVIIKDVPAFKTVVGAPVRYINEI